MSQLLNESISKADIRPVPKKTWQEEIVEWMQAEAIAYGKEKGYGDAFEIYPQWVTDADFHPLSQSGYDNQCMFMVSSDCDEELHNRFYFNIVRVAVENGEKEWEVELLNEENYTNINNYSQYLYQADEPYAGIWGDEFWTWEELHKRPDMYIEILHELEQHGVRLLLPAYHPDYNRKTPTGGLCDFIISRRAWERMGYKLLGEFSVDTWEPSPAQRLVERLQNTKLDYFYAMAIIGEQARGPAWRGPSYFWIKKEEYEEAKKILKELGIERED